MLTADKLQLGHAAIPTLLHHWHDDTQRTHVDAVQRTHVDAVAAQGRVKVVVAKDAPPVTFLGPCLRHTRTERWHQHARQS